MTCIDADVHPLTQSGMKDLLPHVKDPSWRHRLEIYSGFGVGRRPTPIGGAGNIGANYAGDTIPPNGGRPGADPQFMVEQLLNGHEVAHAILTPLEALFVGRLTNIDDMLHLMPAVNDYFIETWLPVDERFKLSIGVQAHDPAGGAEEIRRLADHPQVVAVMLPFIDRLMGHRHYYPIYEAAAEAGLAIVVHPGMGEGEFQGQGTYAVAPPANYTQIQAMLPPLAIANMISLVFDGVFQRYPTLKVSFTEWGCTWAAPIMWRMDDRWRALRIESPWLDEPPSRYVQRHIRFTTQPLEDPEQPEHLLQIFEMMHAEETVLFSSDYPHWDNEFPDFTLKGLPDSLQRRIRYENALDTFSRLKMPVPAGEAG
jgi:predicted TIM-barrel fold metal-dependent hydrolase